MDSSSNSLDVVPVFPLERITDRETTPWPQQQQPQRRKNHLQNLARSLESGDLEQAQRVFDLLVGDEPEPGQFDSLARPLFVELGKALSSGDLTGARTVFAQLHPDVPPVRRQHPQADEAEARELLSGADEDSSSSALDVTA